MFPEEFRGFLWSSGAFEDAFRGMHADLYTVDFWRGIQARIRAGEIIDIYPYGRDKRFRDL